MITTDQLRAWSEALCTLAPSEPRATLAVLGAAENIEETQSWVTAKPPAGARSLRLSKRDNQIDWVELGIENAAAPPRRDLDAAFGTPVEAPPLFGPPLLEQLLYKVRIAGAPFTCTIIAAYGKQPVADSIPHTLTLRRDRAA